MEQTYSICVRLQTFSVRATMETDENNWVRTAQGSNESFNLVLRQRVVDRLEQLITSQQSVLQKSQVPSAQPVQPSFPCINRLCSSPLIGRTISRMQPCRWIVRCRRHSLVQQQYRLVPRKPHQERQQGYRLKTGHYIGQNFKKYRAKLQNIFPITCIRIVI